MRRLLAAVTVAGMALAPLGAQAPGSRQTREFVQAAGESDAFEMAEAYSALAESQDPKVLDFARQMLRDHALSNQKLAEATSRLGLQPPSAVVGAGQAPFLAALQSERGPDFDRAYWHQQVLAHRSALVVARKYAADGDAAAVRAAAAAALPVIQAHLAMAVAMDGNAQ